MPVTDLLERNHKLYGDEVALVELNPTMKDTRKTTWKEYDLVQQTSPMPYRREITWSIFDEKANRIIFRCYSPWVEKKMKILSGQLDNKGILLPEEMRMFPFDKLFNTREETDNTVVNMNFRERFGGLGKEKAEP